MLGAIYHLSNSRAIYCAIITPIILLLTAPVTGAQQIVPDRTSATLQIGGGRQAVAVDEFHPQVSVLVSPHQSKMVTDGAVVLDISPGAVDVPTTIQISPLTENDLPALDPGMTNVTPGPQRGYRLLPHGMKFKKAIQLRIPFDATLIPSGLSTQDVRTFFFDDETGRWQPLPLIKVSDQDGIVISNTNHFTDFINATIMTPEQTDPVSFDSNTIQGIRGAFPTQGITLIQPPQADSKGEAELTFPIEVPPGRNGMDPDLAVSYSSSNGNGWLGLGWDLSAGSITTETRWGVPRYDQALETETYLLNGEQLTPVAHRSDELAARPTAPEKVFHSRREGAFQKIIRHGLGPNDYWWEVVNKDGLRYFYGGTAETGSDLATTLRQEPNSSANIFQWALTEIRDLNGNSIHYEYDLAVDAGLAGSTVDGYQLYLKKINYTQSPGVSGPYTVEFVRESELSDPGRRSDVSIDARGGFKMVTADRLKRINVQFVQGETIRQVRSYDFEYTTGAFEKSLLASITQNGADGSPFYTHEFQYYDDIRSGNQYTGFSPSVTWNAGNDDVDIGFVNLGKITDDFGLGQATVISGATTIGGGGSVYAGFNPFSPTKEFSAGGTAGANYSETQQDLALFDIDGDNLPDKVFKDNGFRFRRNLLQPGSTTGSLFSSSTTAVPTLNSLGLGKETSTVIYGGLEEFFTILGSGVIWSKNTTNAPIYISDANADGLPDVVKNGTVWFNRLENDVPVFQDNSGGTPVPLGAGSTVDTDGLLDEEALQQFVEDSINEFPLQDTIRRWVAPYNGRISISGPIQLTGGTGDDGVRVAIQHNANELWFAAIPANDSSPRTPAGVSSISVARGDRIYFRLQSDFDGKDDIVSWNPQIAYLAPPPAPRDLPRTMDTSTFLDVNGKDPYLFDASNDFVLAGRRQIFVQVPFTGVVHLTGDLIKAAQTTDDVGLVITKNDDVIYTDALDWNAVGSLPVDLDISVVGDDSTTTDVNEADIIRLRVQVDSNIDLTQIQWIPLLYYTESPDITPINDDSGNPSVKINPPYDIDFYPVNDLVQPQVAWTVPDSVSQLTVTTTLTAASHVSTDVVFTVKERGARLSKHVIPVTSGSVSPLSFTLPVEGGKELFFDFSLYDGNLRSGFSNASVEVAYTNPDDTSKTIHANVPSAFHSTTPFEEVQDVNTIASDALQDQLFAQPYRGWTYVGYNGNRDRAFAPIDESLLVLDLQEVRITPPAKPSSGSSGLDRAVPVRFMAFCSDSASAYVYNPAPGKNAWQGPSDYCWVQAGAMRSSRVGSQSIPQVPTAQDFAGATAPTRMSVDNATSGRFLVYAHSGSDSKCRVDYLDLNGDGFPDILGNDGVQYTTMQGGLEPSKVRHSLLSPVRQNSSQSDDLGISFSPKVGKSNSKGQTDTSNKSTPKGNGKGDLSVGLGFGVGTGSSQTNADLFDMNGDGLPDRVTWDDQGLHVAFNLGYSFERKELWHVNGLINAGDNSNWEVSVGLGYSTPSKSYSGGVSYDRTESKATKTLVDMNGDGLPDLVRETAAQDDKLEVAFNTGAGFTEFFEWPHSLRCTFRDPLGIDWRNDARISFAANVGLGAGGSFTFGIGPLCLFACYIIVNPAAYVEDGRSRQEIALIDMNGDRYPDHVKSTSTNSIEIAENPIGRTNLLRLVTRPLGGTITLDYTRDGNSYEQPNSTWVLSQVEVYDGQDQPGDGEDSQLITYAYEGGRENRLEREFFGYSRVVEEHRNPQNPSSVYRRIVRDYTNGSFYTAGLLQRLSIEDGSGNPYIESENTYRLRDVETGFEATPNSSAGQLLLASTTATVFPMLMRTDERYYEGQTAAEKFTYTTRDYDDFGNVVSYFDAVDVGSSDDVQVEMEYAPCQDSYIVGIPTRIVVSSNGTVYRQREADVDCASGLVSQVREFLEDGRVAVTDMSYYPNGSLQRITGPPNLKMQRYEVAYEYDPVLRTHLARITDSFGLSSESTYDPLFGKVTSVEDRNRNRTLYSYDPFGRLLTVRGPYEVDAATPTMSFEYHPHDAVPWALTRHHDPLRDNDPIETVVFADGLGRIIQTKKDASLFQGADVPSSDGMIVTGRVKYDFLGRPIEVYYPMSEGLGQAGIFNQSVNSVAPTSLEYDVLDRNTRITLPSGATTTVSYGFGVDRNQLLQFVAAVTDGNGNPDPLPSPPRFQKKIYRDVSDLITSVQEFNDNGNEVIWTSYGYNPMAELIAVIDDHGNEVTTGYDNLGRRTYIDHPDAGRTEVVYDLASNLIAKVTPNLRANGQQIAFDYDYNRLMAIAYPTFPQNDVTYRYGDPGAPYNRAGRLYWIEDQSGREERFFGPLGEITKEIKTFASDTQGRSANSPEVYVTQYTYDTWGRLRSLVYPDGEVLEYGYDSGGLVCRAIGTKNGVVSEYLSRLAYDEFSQRRFLKYGNSVLTEFHYSTESRLLENLVCGKAFGTPFQNLSFEYDRVGNILQVSNNVPVTSPSQFGGPAVQSFTYDDLYRLVHANGTYTPGSARVSSYSLDLDYDSIHNLLRKNQRHEIVQPSGQGVRVKGTTYGWDYAYGTRPHAPIEIGKRAFSFDANGNQTGWSDSNNGTRRTIIWDEENRIQSIGENGQELTYKYDHEGRRAMKRGPQGETAYINPFFTIRNGQIATKHYYVGESRIASVLGKYSPSGGSTSDRPVVFTSSDALERHAPRAPAVTPYLKNAYFYHSNQTGSSVYVTDSRGAIYQHLEYFPFGETWVQEATNIQRTPYLFAGNELDEETGLYYCGTRYFDPRTGLWTSVDPTFGAYLGGAYNGGVFNPHNLAVYAFGFQNPVKYTNLDGQTSDSIYDAFDMLLGVSPFAGDAIQGHFWSVATDAISIGVDIASSDLPSVSGSTNTGSFSESPGLSISFKSRKTTNPATKKNIRPHQGKHTFEKTNKETRETSKVNKGGDPEPTPPGGGAVVARTIEIDGESFPVIGGNPTPGRILKRGLREIKSELPGMTVDDARAVFDELRGSAETEAIPNTPGFMRAKLSDGRELIFRPVNSAQKGGIPKLVIKDFERKTSEEISFQP